MVAGPNELLVGNDPKRELLLGEDHEQDYLANKWTFEEYLEELDKPIEYPDRLNKDDPRYYRKYAHNLPPKEAYFMIPDRKDQVATNK